MSGVVGWFGELAVRPGELAHLRELTREMVASARTEPGIALYERFVTADGTTVHLHERFEDSASALAHLRLFHSRFAARFTAVVERQRILVYGEPDTSTREVLDGIGATYLIPLP